MVKKIKRPDPELIDEENPEWTVEDFARARPARDVLREQFGEAIAAEMLKPKGGRPKSAAPKVLLSVRYSPDVIEHFRATGEGWQARMDSALREWINGQSKRTSRKEASSKEKVT
jgi:uncharacterized protein (DUF4415 family)